MQSSRNTTAFLSRRFPALACSGLPSINYSQLLKFEITTRGSLMPKAVVIDDSLSDLRQATEILKNVGVSEVEHILTVPKACIYLQEVVDGKRGAPDLIILDLQFPLESGFEVLRFRRSNREVSAIPVVVWTIMGPTEQELCRFFGATVVPKHEGPKGLEGALKSVLIPA